MSLRRLAITASKPDLAKAPAIIQQIVKEFDLAAHPADPRQWDDRGNSLIFVVPGKASLAKNVRLLLRRSNAEQKG